MHEARVHGAPDRSPRPARGPSTTTPPGPTRDRPSPGSAGPRSAIGRGGGGRRGRDSASGASASTHSSTVPPGPRRRRPPRRPRRAAPRPASIRDVRRRLRRPPAPAPPPVPPTTTPTTTTTTVPTHGLGGSHDHVGRRARPRHRSVRWSDAAATAARPSGRCRPSAPPPTVVVDRRRRGPTRPSACWPQSSGPRRGLQPVPPRLGAPTRRTAGRAAAPAGQPAPLRRPRDGRVAVAVRTAGIVDPTIGSALVELGYDRDFDGIGRRPDRGGCPPAPGPGLVADRARPDRPHGDHPDGVHVDLGSTAKAFAADRAAARIAEALGCGVLVNLGGDVAVAGPPPAGGWGVGIAPRAPRRRPTPTRWSPSASGGLATSGTTARTWSAAAARSTTSSTPGPAEPRRPPGRWCRRSPPTCVEANALDDGRRRLGRGRPGQPRRPRCRGPPGRTPTARWSGVGGWPGGTGPRSPRAGTRRPDR